MIALILCQTCVIIYALFLFLGKEMTEAEKRKIIFKLVIFFVGISIGYAGGKIINLVIGKF